MAASQLIAMAMSIAPAVSHVIVDADQYTKLVSSTANGKLYRVAAPDATPLDVLHLYGSAYERGEAHGERLVNGTTLQN